MKKVSNIILGDAYVEVKESFNILQRNLNAIAEAHPEFIFHIDFHKKRVVLIDMIKEHKGAFTLQKRISLLAYNISDECYGKDKRDDKKKNMLNNIRTFLLGRFELK